MRCRHPDHALLQPKDLWVHWLQTVGRGANLILNMPPNTTGTIPDEYAASAAAFGRAIAASFKNESAVVGDAASTYATKSSSTAAAVTVALPPVQCKADGTGGYITLEIPAGATADAIVAAEDLAQGQSIGSYTIEVRNGTRTAGDGGNGGRDAGGAGAWVTIAGLHGQTVGHKLVDTMQYAPVAGPVEINLLGFTENLLENTDGVLRPGPRCWCWSEHPISVLSGRQPATFYSC